MKAKQKIGIFSIVLVALMLVCSVFLWLPKTQKQTYALTNTQEQALSKLQEFEPDSYYEGLFSEKKYNEIISKNQMGFFTYFSQLFSFDDISQYGYEFEKYDIDKLSISPQDKKMLKDKIIIINNLKAELNKYLVEVYSECKGFNTRAMLYNISEITEPNNNLKTFLKDDFKESNENNKFWNDIYLSYAEYANESQTSLNTGAQLAKEGTANIDNCINKLTLLETRDDDFAHFKEEIEKLPAIVDVKKEHEEALNKLKKELDEYYTTYAVHLSDDDKKTIEDYQWQVNKSLERINKSDSNWAIFWVALIVAGIAAIIMLLKYFVFPLIKKKRGRRK